MNIEDHPTVKRMRAIARVHVENEKDGIDADWTQGEKARGYILACQALAESDVVVEL